MKTPSCPNCGENETIIRHSRNDFECPNCNTVWAQSTVRKADAREGMVPAVELRPTIAVLRKLASFYESTPFQYAIDEINRLETLLGEKGGK